MTGVIVCLNRPSEYLNVLKKVKIAEKISQPILKCYHCGNTIKETKLEANEHQFCCLGCKSVYEILNQNALCDYYSFNDNPGNNLGTTVLSDEYAFLDEKSLVTELIDFTDGSISKVRLHLPQIHCASCIWLLENLSRLENSIINSRVNFDRKEIVITYNEQEGSLRRTVELLAAFGYKPTINLETSEKKFNQTDKKIYYQLGVAGFFFGNIMLTSFPEYFGLSGAWFKEFGPMFRWLNFVFVLPVLFYSASDYLQNALSALQTRIINLDVPIVIGMLALFGRSTYEIVSGTGAGYFDSLAGFIFFLLLGKIFQARTYSTMSFERDFKSFFPLSITKLVDGKIQATKVTKLEIGDCIRVKNGEIIPTDAALMSEEAYIDYSFITGEAVPVRKSKGDFIYAGGKQVGTSIELIVSKTVEESYLADLWRKEGIKQNNGLASIADQVGKYFTMAVLAIGLLTLIYWLIIDANVAFPAFTSVLIVACPCALALSIPFTYGTAMRVLSRAGFFIKDSALIEKMAQINHLVFDKTGTLTSGNNNKVHYTGAALSNAELKAIKALVDQSQHPLSQAIFQKIEVDESPLESGSFQEETGKGIHGIINGNYYRIGSAAWLGQNHQIESSVHIEINESYRGFYSIKQNYRNGLSKAISSLIAHYKVFVLSGDNETEKANLSKWFGSTQALLFNRKPHEKLDFIRHLKAEGAQVAMIGDGLNDAGALNESQFGISVTDHTNNFTPASSAIVMGESLVKLPTFLLFAQKARRIIFWAFALSFTYNIVGMSFAVQGKLSPVISAILMPLSSITVVLFVTLTTLFTAKKMRLL